MVDFRKFVLLSILVLGSCSYLQADNAGPQAGAAKQQVMQGDNEWPIMNAPGLLSGTMTNVTASAPDNEGKSVQFVVAEEYLSATGHQCKKYYVNLSPYLACYGDNWYPVRVF